VQLIERRIYLIRGHKVFIDFDPADLYGVSTKQLNQQVRRNSKRFPEDFMFRLTTEEADALRSQFVTSNTARGARRYLPYECRLGSKPARSNPQISPIAQI